MSAREYGCNYCRITFIRPNPDNLKDKTDLKCPRCGSANIQKFDNLADKLEFFRRFVFSGG